MYTLIKHQIAAKTDLLLLLLLLFIFLSLPVSAVSASEKANRSSSSGIFWATAKDEGDLLRKSEVEEATARENEELEGGFSSLDGMLQWAIGNSDPVKLKEKAKDVQHLSKSDLAKRQLELKELMEKLKMPSDAELMQIAIADLNNSSLSLEDRHRALHELLVLVEPIDNANDLDKLQGLDAVCRELHHSEPEIRTTAAWIIGKASQNNPLVQNQILERGTLPVLMKMVKSNSVEEAVKALYAVSAVIRNNVVGQELFYAEAGDLMLQDIMSNSSSDIRLRRKSIFLVADMADGQLANTKKVALPFFSNRLFLKSVVDQTASTDLDLQEKALVAIRSLLKLSFSDPLVFKDFCGLDEALKRMREQFEELMLEDNQKDFVMDMEILRRDVEVIFQGKLEKLTWVPT